MYKAKILVIIVVFLALFSFIVVSDEQTDRQAQEDFIRENYGMGPDEFLLKNFKEGVTLDDVYIDPYTGVAYINNGYAVLTSETSLPVVLNGEEALVDVQQYSGTIEIGVNGGVIQGKHSLLVFNGGETVTVVDGVIVQLEHVNLDEGSRIDDTFVYGKDISYDIENRRIISGNDIMIDNIFYKPESGNNIIFEIPLKNPTPGFPDKNRKTKIDTQGKWVIMEKNGMSIGKIKGIAEVRNENSILLIASEDDPCEFENPKGTKIKVSSDTSIGNWYSSSSDEISKIYVKSEFDGNYLFSDFYVDVKGKNKIEIEAEDGVYWNFIVNQDDEDSEVKLVLKKDIFNKGVFYFKEGRQLEQGSLRGFETNINYVFKDTSQKLEGKQGISTPLHYAITLTPTPLLNKLTRDYGRGLKALSHYLYASGEPMEIDLSEEEWNELIEQTEDEEREWIKSTNPEYHSDDGWEYMDQLGPPSDKDEVDLGGFMSQIRQSDAWNLLGKTTLRRRKIDEGYHYMIAGETFDFVGGEWERAEEYTRVVTRDIAKLGEFFFSDIFRTVDYSKDFPDDKTEWVTLSVNTNWVQKHGKPFPITGEYIKKDG